MFNQNHRWFAVKCIRRVFLLFLFGNIFTFIVNAALLPLSLLCEYCANPPGIYETQPRLTWRVESSERGQKQTAYQILVASSAVLLYANTGDLWDSGEISSGETVNLANFLRQRTRLRA